MPISVEMPRLSDTMEEGTLMKWRVSVGDQVQSGDVLADIETDKATMELQSYDDGAIAKLVAQEGQTLPVGSLILILAQEGEDPEEAAKTGGNATEAPPEADTELPTDSGPSSDSAGSPEPSRPAEGARVRVSPLARKIAEEHGVDLGALAAAGGGSGPGGRIIKRDVLAAAEGARPSGPKPLAPGAAPPRAAASLEDRTITLSSMRKTIARRLLESKTTIPHFTVTVQVHMDALLGPGGIKKQLEARDLDLDLDRKLSVNDFVVRAAALALLEHPGVNASWGEDAIRQHGHVNIGIAVALPEEKGGGLVVPVIRDAPSKTLAQIGAETRALATKARDTGLTPDEMSGGTFTVSNLGMFGVEHFEAIINPPQAAILAVGAGLQKPVVREGQVVPGFEMACTLSADHRIVDGAAAASFLATFRTLLENPAGLLL